MDTSKIIKGVVSNGRYTVTAPIVKEDYGLYLQIEGVELPSTYEVDFSNSENSGTSVTMIGNSDGVLIPRQFIDSGKDVFAFLYHVGANYGRTVYKFRIPNKVRPDRTDEQPTPEEQSVIDQAINALNEAVAQTAQDVIDADQSARSASDDADRAEQAKEDASTFAQRSANSAQASADYSSSAQTSATASANSAEQAESAKGVAQSYAQDAQTSATYASLSESTASTKASEASGYASTASQKATEASQSASQALGYKNDAESAKTASQTAQGLAESARDSAISAKNDAEQAKADAESARDEAQSAVASISGALAEKAPIITDTASGSIASFSDGADNLPLKSLVVDINPIQDLHGQENPYPAGGGKNKITATEYGGNLYGESAGKDLKNLVDVQDYTENGNVITVNVETAWRGRLFATSVLPAGDYHVHFETTEAGTRATFYVTDADLVVERYIANKLGAGTTSTSVTLTDSQRIAVIFANYQVGTVTVTNLQVESGSAYTSWSPYENLCPISGWTEVDVEQRGVNVWDEEWEVGRYNPSTGVKETFTTTIRSKNYIPIVPNTSYYCYIGSVTVGHVNFCYYDVNKNFISFASETTNPKITPSNAHYMTLYVDNVYGTTYNHDISINYPSTDHSYHPYTGRSLTINLGQTVYGGKLDVLSGILTVYPYYDSYNGETLTGEWISDRDKYVAGTTPTIGAQVVNIGAQGVTVQLEPYEVESLYGVNNLWADSGDTEAVYRADTKAYIAKKIAEAISALS